MAASDLDVIKDIPGFKVILKTVLKAQIQQLVEQLVAHTDEESVILTASVSDGTISHLGSDFGKGFLEEQENIKTQFLSFCLKRHHQKLQEEKESQRQTTLAAQAPLAGQFDYGTGPRRNTRMPYHTSPRQAVFPKGGFNVRSQRHEPYPVLRPDRRTSFTESGQGSLSSPAGENVAVKTELSDTDSQEGNDSVSRDDDNTYSSFGASEQSGSKAGENIEDSSEIDAKVVKVEAVSDSDFELENTGVEPGQSVHPDNLDLNVSVGMNFNQSQGISGSMTDADDQHNLGVLSPSGSRSAEQYCRPKSGVLDPEFASVNGMQELFPATGVYVHLDQFQTALSKSVPKQPSSRTKSSSCSKRDGKRVGRYLLTVFFSKEELRSSSLMKSELSQYPALNRQIVEAILELNSGISFHICPVCKRAVQSAYALKVHMRSHSGEQPYQCSECNKRFSQSSSLYRHIRSHRKEKAYQCSLCEGRFAQSSDLNRHVQTHLKE